MGQIIQVQCTSCGYEKKLNTGGGLADCQWETILAALPESGRRALAAAVRDGAVQCSVTRRLCACDSCGAVYALPIVSFRLKGVQKELYGVCPQCGRAGNASWKETDQLLCPVCGHRMTQQQAGHWD